MNNEEVTTYCGQSTDGWEFIGTDEFRLPITSPEDVPNIIAELKRCCGELADFYLYKAARA